MREATADRFRYVLVDEYQDTNRAQYELVRASGGPHGNVTVVGDEDQSIYSWRGADIQNILDFERDFPGARVLRLEENYRSQPGHPRRGLGPRGPQPQAQGQDAAGGQARPARRCGCTGAGDEFQEAAWVVEQIAAARRDARAAILFRMNAQSRLLEEALLRLRIPYVVVGGVGFYERKEVKDLLAYLRLRPEPPRRGGAAACPQRAAARDRGPNAWPSSSGSPPSAAASACGRPWPPRWTRRCFRPAPRCRSDASARRSTRCAPRPSASA